MATAVAKLDGRQFETVSNVIRAGFADYPQLANFTTMKLDLKLADLTAPVGLEEAAGKIIEWASENGAIERLLSMLRLWFPDSEPLQQLIQALGIRIEDFAAVAPGKLAGMEAVAANPATRSAIVRYRPEIAKLCGLAIRLGGLKYLHDKVDGLRNQVYVPLEAIRARMPAPDAEDLIDQYQRNMAAYARDIEAKVEEVKIPEDDLPWIEERLLPAQQKLLFASQNWPAEPEINAVVTWLNGVTGPNLSELNGMIKATASGIGELGFHDKMLQMKADVGVALVAHDVVAALGDDVDRVDAGITILLGRVAEHSRWQNIKDQLGDLIMSRGRPIDESRFSWDILEKRLGKVEKPPEKLPAARSEVVAAFAAADQRQLKNAVNVLRTIIDERFYSIDKELLADATYVSQLGDGLQQVLETLDG